MIDKHGRKIDYVRISVTDRCNLRCVYCMPEKGIELAKCEEILSYEEIIKACKGFAKLGIKKIKLTGGEPLVRKNICQLVKAIKAIPGIEQVTITTNGVLLGTMAKDLADAGIDGVNISLDTLDEATFERLTRKDELNGVIDGIDQLMELGVKSIKINCVPIAEFNQRDIIEMVKFTQDRNIAIRFIELMPIGYAKEFTPIGKEKIIEMIEEVYGPLRPFSEKLGNGPAEYYTLDGFQGKIGFIDALGNKFCSTCNRIRLTSSGFLKLCLHYNKGINIRPILQQNNDIAEIAQAMQDAIYNKPQEHHFAEQETIEDVDDRKMFQIGG